MLSIFSEDFMVLVWAGWVAWNIKADYENRQALKEIKEELRRLKHG